jgi:hypothetical protein
MLAFYPWACTHGGGATIVEYDDEDNAEHTIGACHDEVRFDSCGIFALKPITNLHRVYNPEHLQDPAKLHQFPTGQGYAVKSYVGQNDAVLTSLRNIHDGGEKDSRLPTCYQKLVNMDKWDPNHALWNKGGHMPLLVYVGEHCYRGNDSLTRREGEHIKRGWGPFSANRIAQFRKRQGTWQPRSPEQTTAGATADAADAAPGESAEQQDTSETHDWFWPSEPWASSSASSSQWWPR